MVSWSTSSRSRYHPTESESQNARREADKESEFCFHGGMSLRVLATGALALVVAGLGFTTGAPVRGDAPVVSVRDVGETRTVTRPTVPSGSPSGQDAVSSSRLVPPPQERAPSDGVVHPDRPCPRCGDTPDLTQSASAFGLPHGGGSYCGPVATTNALVWLSARGFPALISDRGLEQMPRHLAFKRFLKTHPRRGTLPFDLVRGLERWVHAAGYEVETLAYAGVRDHPTRLSFGVLRPGLPLLAEGLTRDGVVLLHVGWYEEARAGRYSRVGGHWLTLLDVDVQTGVLRASDPAPYASEGRPERIVARPMTDGHLLRPAGLGELAARGFLELGEGMALRDPRERAILDGAVVLRLHPPSAAATDTESLNAEAASSPATEAR